MSAVGNGSATGAPITINVNGVGTITVADPVINFGYNTKGGGAPIDLAKGSAYFQIEGNYDRGATGDVWGEAFITFKGPGSTGPARPLFFGYDWEQNRVVSGSVAVGLGQSFWIGFNDYITQGTSGGHRFDENRYTLFKASEETAEASQIRVGAHANQAAEIILADNDDDPAVRQKFKFRMAPGAASVTDGEMTISMYDNNATPASRAIKTGKIFFNASTASDTIRMGIGKNNFNTTDVGILNVYVENGLTSNTGIYVKAKTSQTGSLLRLDGINNGTGVAEVATWTVRPRGEIVVRESGNTSTDRPPTAGSGGPTAFPTAANKPGTAIGSATVTWFPMLDTSGALFWVPGWSA